jgi:hypothetical protein
MGKGHLALIQYQTLHVGEMLVELRTQTMSLGTVSTEEDTGDALARAHVCLSCIYQCSYQD